MPGLRPSRSHAHPCRRPLGCINAADLIVIYSDRKIFLKRAKRGRGDPGEPSEVNQVKSVGPEFISSRIEKNKNIHYRRRPDLISKRLQYSKIHLAHPNRRSFIHGITNPTVRMDRSRDATNWIHNCLARGKASCQLAAPWSTTLPFAARDLRWRTSCSSLKFQSAASGHTRLHPHSRCRDDPRESLRQEL